MDQQTGRKPRGDEFEKQVDVGGRQRLHGRVAREDFGQQLASGGTLGEEFRHRHRRLEHQRSMDHVAEVEYAHAMLAGFVQQQVARMTVAVNRLRAQAPQLAEPGSEPIERTAHQLAAGRRIQVIGILEQRRRLAHVPGDALREGHVKKSRQGVVKSRQRLADGIERAGIARPAGGECAWHERDQAQLIGCAGDHALAQGRAATRPDDARHRKLGRLLGEVVQHRALAVQNRGIGSRIDDLQHVLAPVGADEPEIAITLTRQEARATLNVVDFQRQAFGVRRCDRRRIGLQRDQTLDAQLLLSPSAERTAPV